MECLEFALMLWQLKKESKTTIQLMPHGSFFVAVLIVS